MYLKLRKYYQIEYYLYCLKFTKFCIFHLKDNSQSLPHKNIFTKSKLPVNSTTIKTIYSGFNFNLVYFQYFKEFYNFFSKNANVNYFIKTNNLILTNESFGKFITDIIRRPSFVLILKPIISILKVLNYLKNADFKTSL